MYGYVPYLSDSKYTCIRILGNIYIPRQEVNIIPYIDPYLTRNGYLAGILLLACSLPSRPLPASTASCSITRLLALYLSDYAKNRIVLVRISIRAPRACCLPVSLPNTRPRPFCSLYFPRIRVFAPCHLVLLYIPLPGLEERLLASFPTKQCIDFFVSTTGNPTGLPTCLSSTFLFTIVLGQSIPT
ncbi:hypothetical protein CABS01_08560 [Colletotrichum abscissum]|uniref:uncharacterized protein n=1 Tax=Colletotrichum abscissum TaxID=1671311 RepID=UPI0027D5FEB5|nr:uncharacterized protein CABS01_08560 [Colletotrichum abscissum]KAK1507380.1 hypothetical protein CABS01_08560 [Colletotrichum abscissum]